MSSTLQDYFAVITPALPSELVSPVMRSKLQSLTTMFPPLSSGLLECRLHQMSEQVDLSVRLSRSVLNWSPELLGDTLWKTVHNFYNQWLEQTYSWYQYIDHLWLEMDLDPVCTQQSTPGIFLCLKQTDHVILIEIITNFFQFFQCHLSVQQLYLIERCADSLPDGAQIKYVGMMLSRSAHSVRLNVKGLIPSQFVHDLGQIGYGESIQDFLSQMETLFHLIDDIILTFDVDRTIQPRIGFECFIHNAPDHVSGWSVFLDHLVDQGLCTRAKRHALLTWPGVVQKAQTPELWPDHLSWMEQLLGHTVFSVFRRSINHIKLVYEPEGLEAKAYLAFEHIFGDRQTLSPLGPCSPDAPPRECLTADRDISVRRH